MKTPQEKGRAFEYEVAALYGGKVQPGSGNTTHRKGDVVTPHFLLQCKYTTASQHTVHAGTLQEVEQQANRLGRYPGYLFSLLGKEYCILQADWLHYIQQKLDEDSKK